MLCLRRGFGLLMKSKTISTCVTLAWLCFAVNLMWPGALSAADGKEQKTGPAAAEQLEGTWIRPDGGYVLELHNIKDDGTLSAAYFNPRQIRVSQAIWGNNEGSIAIFIELRDVNYPGSKYSLRYNPVSDRLQGVYFQAMEQQSYEVEFVRNR
jgi:hypothetical protein